MSTLWKDTDISSAIAGKESDRNRALQYLVQGAGWRQQVMRHVVANSGTEEDGEEVFFDALTVFDRNVREGKFEGRSAMNTYFFQIAKFVWLKRLAKRRPALDVKKLLDTDQAVEDSVEKALIGAEHEQVFAQVMSKVGERCKRIFALFHLGHSMVEIALEVGISDADQAKKEKSRCKKRLLNLLAERPELLNFFKDR
jgi:RNA polymerase sigma factor (sigma-70 family)